MASISSLIEKKNKLENRLQKKLSDFLEGKKGKKSS